MNAETLRRVVMPVLLSVAAVLVAIAAIVVIVDVARDDGGADTAAVAGLDGAATTEPADADGIENDGGDTADGASGGDGAYEDGADDAYEDSNSEDSLDDAREDGDDWYADDGDGEGAWADIADFVLALLDGGALGELLQWLIGAIFGIGDGPFGGRFGENPGGDGAYGGFGPFGGRFGDNPGGGDGAFGGFGPFGRFGENPGGDGAFGGFGPFGRFGENPGGGDGAFGGFGPFGGDDYAAAVGPPLIGVAVEETADGLRVASVAPGLGADAAGIEEGDVIVAVGGEAIGGTAQLRALLADVEPGDEVSVRVERGGRERSLRVTLAPGLAFATEGAAPRFGFRAGGTPGGGFGFEGGLDELGDLLESGELDGLLESGELGELLESGALDGLLESGELGELLESGALDDLLGRNPALRDLLGDGLGGLFGGGADGIGGLFQWFLRLFGASDDGWATNAPCGAFGSADA